MRLLTPLFLAFVLLLAAAFLAAASARARRFAGWLHFALAVEASAFLLWLTLLLFLDLILLGVMIRGHLPPETAVALALVNPLQVFRTAAMLLLDQQLVMLGPSAYVILDAFGQTGYIAFALFYPTLLGTLSAWLGYVLFKRSDLP